MFVPLRHCVIKFGPYSVFAREYCIALDQIATLPMVVAGIAILVAGIEGLYWLVAGMIFSTLVALFEAWVLLVEINR
jgi:hypothetical protein